MTIKCARAVAQESALKHSWWRWWWWYDKRVTIKASTHCRVCACAHALLCERPRERWYLRLTPGAPSSIPCDVLNFIFHFVLSPDQTLYESNQQSASAWLFEVYCFSPFSEASSSTVSSFLIFYPLSVTVCFIFVCRLSSRRDRVQQVPMPFRSDFTVRKNETFAIGIYKKKNLFFFNVYFWLFYC